METARMPRPLRILVVDDEKPVAAGLYHSAQIRTNQAWRLPEVMPMVRGVDLHRHDKLVVFLSDGFAHKLAARFPIRAILIPKVRAGATTHVSPASPEDSLNALIPTTARRVLAPSRKTMEILAALVHRIPSYLLELGPDLSQIPPVIRAVLHDLEPRVEVDLRTLL